MDELTRFKSEEAAFRERWYDDSTALEVCTSGSTGSPKKIFVDKNKMAASATQTCRFLGLNRGDSALLCMPLEYIAGQMMCVRAYTHGLRLVIVPPSSRPLRNLDTPITFAAMTPMQVFETLHHPEEKARLSHIRQLIIGGGAISDNLSDELRDFPHAVWSTYGMTETLSHIAMRRLNGKEASDWYTPLHGVKITLNTESCLVIDAPHVCDRTLITNDISEIHIDGSFRILGRKDNVICSGGIKMQIESIEERIGKLEADYAITSLPDEKYGEIIVMLHTGLSEEETMAICRAHLNRYEVPKRLISCHKIPKTGSGKIARQEVKKMAMKLSSIQ